MAIYISGIRGRYRVQMKSDGSLALRFVDRLHLPRNMKKYVSSKESTM